MTAQNISDWKYSAALTVRNDPDLFQALKPEMERAEDSRARIRLELQGSDVVIRFEAKDVNALRSRVNGIAKLISVYEDMRSVAKE